jgi:hypothetical protein
VNVTLEEVAATIRVELDNYYGKSAMWVSVGIGKGLVFYIQNDYLDNYTLSKIEEFIQYKIANEFPDTEFRIVKLGSIQLCGR